MVTHLCQCNIDIADSGQPAKYPPAVQHYLSDHQWASVRRQLHASNHQGVPYLWRQWSLTSAHTMAHNMT